MSWLHVRADLDTRPAFGRMWDSLRAFKQPAAPERNQDRQQLPDPRLQDTHSRRPVRSLHDYVDAPPPELSRRRCEKISNSFAISRCDSLHSGEDAKPQPTSCRDHPSIVLEWLGSRPSVLDYFSAVVDTRTPARRTVGVVLRRGSSLSGRDHGVRQTVRGDVKSDLSFSLPSTLAPTFYQGLHLDVPALTGSTTACHCAPFSADASRSRRC